jgi:hypothetical protein
MLGTDAGAGRAGMEIAACGEGLGRSPTPAGKGCRGPEIICPGRGEGTGLAGTAVPRVACGAEGNPGAPPPDTGDRGGRNGCGFTPAAGTSSGASLADSGLAGSGLADSGRASRRTSGSGLTAGCGRGASCAGDAGTETGGAASATGCAATSLPESDAAEPLLDAPPSAATRRRISSAMSSSTELECVFLPVTPSSVSRSRILFGLTSSSRASSLIRILLIQ